MANPANPNSLDLWIAAGMPFGVLTPRAGDTGTLDTWIAAGVPWGVYVEFVLSGYALTANDVTSGAPAVGTATLGQVHLLTATDVARARAKWARGWCISPTPTIRWAAGGRPPWCRA